MISLCEQNFWQQVIDSVSSIANYVYNRTLGFIEIIFPIGKCNSGRFQTLRSEVQIDESSQSKL